MLTDNQVKEQASQLEKDSGALVVVFSADGFVYGRDTLNIVLAEHWQELEDASAHMLLVYDPLYKRIVHGVDLLAVLASLQPGRTIMRELLRAHDAEKSKETHPF